MAVDAGKMVDDYAISNGRQDGGLLYVGGLE
jgi:hypothetical protein